MKTVEEELREKVRYLEALLQIEREANRRLIELLAEAKAEKESE